MSQGQRQVGVVAPAPVSSSMSFGQSQTVFQPNPAVEGIAVPGRLSAGENVRAIGQPSALVMRSITPTERATVLPAGENVRAIGQPSALVTRSITPTERATVLPMPATERTIVHPTSREERATVIENIAVPSPMFSAQSQSSPLIKEKVVVTENIPVSPPMFAGESPSRVKDSVMVSENIAPLSREVVTETEKIVGSSQMFSSQPRVTVQTPSPFRERAGTVKPFMFSGQPENLSNHTENISVPVEAIVPQEESVVCPKVEDSGETEYVESVITFNAAPSVIISENNAEPPVVISEKTYSEETGSASLTIEENMSLYEPWLGKQDHNLIKTPVPSRDNWGCCCGRLW